MAGIRDSSGDANPLGSAARWEGGSKKAIKSYDNAGAPGFAGAGDPTNVGTDTLMCAPCHKQMGRPAPNWRSRTKTLEVTNN